MNTITLSRGELGPVKSYTSANVYEGGTRYRAQLRTHEHHTLARYRNTWHLVRPRAGGVGYEVLALVRFGLQEAS